MVRQRILITCMISCSLLVSGCTDQGTSTPNSSIGAANVVDPKQDQTDETNPSLIICSEAWDRYVASNPLNHFEKTEIAIEESSDGRIYKQTSKAINQRTVVESSDVEVTVLTNNKITFPESLPATEEFETITKAKFIDRCLFTGDTAQHPIVKERVIETGNETITVPAGTFACEYKKVSRPDLESNSTELIISSWQTTINGLTMTIRSITDSIIATEGVLSFERKTVELLEWK